MIRNYLKIAIRNLARQKLYVSVNAAGLAIGLAVCLLIVGFVNNELTFENCHENKDRIYRVDGAYSFRNSGVSMANIMPAVGPAMADAFEEVESAVRFRTGWNVSVKFNQNMEIEEEVIGIAEPQLFSVFTLPLKHGNPHTALEAPLSAVISADWADTYFGNEDPVGSFITLYDSMEVQITGVLEEVPANTQLQRNLWLSYASLERMGQDVSSWTEIFQDYTYVLLHPGADPTEVENRIPALLEANLEPDVAKMFELQMQPLGDIYLYSDLSYELQPQGDETNIYIFSCIAAVILIIACINFVNLTTARTAHRGKEVGVRKVLGARRSQLVIQFLSESVAFGVFSMLLGIALFEVSRPMIESFAEREFEISFLDPILLASILGMILIVGLISGGYPALLLSRFRPVQVLKRGLIGSTGRPVIRRVLVAIQFSAAIALICMTVAIFKQIDYCLTKDPGFSHENVMLLNVEDEVTPEQRQLLKSRLLASSSVLAASIVDNAPGEPRYSLYSISPENKADEDATLINGFRGDYDFFETFGLELVQGQVPSEDMADENSNVVVINEAALNEFEIEDPIGFRFIRPTNDFVVVGVMKDIHTHSMHNQIYPVMVSFGSGERRSIALKLAGENLEAAIAGVREVWSEVFPYRTMEYTFLDDIMAEAYDGEQRVGTLFGVFTMLAVFVASLGLFGLAAYQAEQRTREIGIRKVLGASITSIVRLLCKESTVLVAAASVVAWPVAYYVVNLWLEEFAYRMTLGWLLFAASGLLALAIAFVTISFQSIRAARTNLVETLKHE